MLCATRTHSALYTPAATRHAAGPQQPASSQPSQLASSQQLSGCVDAVCTRLHLLRVPECLQSLQAWHYRSPQPDHKSQDTKRNEELSSAIYAGTAAEFLALTEEKQSKLSLDFMYLRDKGRHRVRLGREAQRGAWCKTAGRGVVLLITFCLFSDRCLFGAIQGTDFS